MRKSLLFISIILLSTKLLAVSETQIKAVFLEKFTHLIEWPKSDKSYFSVCILNDDDFAEILEKVYIDKTYHDRPVKILRVSDLSKIPQCDLLFIGKNTKNVSSITDKYTSSALLTVSDNKQFLNKNVMITFYLRDKRFKYIINNKAAKDANIKISYLLLKSAEEVIQ